jgi:hypothetical protein
MRELLRTVLFSPNEMESLLRQSFGAISGPNKALWQQFYAGGAIFLAITANIVHMAATGGEPLPLDRYLPIKRDPYSPVGIGYNDRFFAPDVPLMVGRGGARISMDLMGQMDTVLRVFDPVGFITSRTAIFPRTLINQAAGEDFFGRPLNTPLERGAQLASDLGAPIGVGNVLGAVRNKVPGLSAVVPENEGRLGTVGQLAQASGVNLRAETTRMFLDRHSEERFGVSYDELEPWQRREITDDKPINEELEKRRTTGALRGSEYAQRGVQRTYIEDQRLQEEAGLAQQLKAGLTGRKVRDTYGDIQARAADQAAGLDLAYQDSIQTRERSDDPQEQALFDYYDVFRSSKDVAGTTDFDAVDAKMAALEATWTEAQKGYIERNTGLKNHDPGLDEFMAAKEQLGALGFFEISDNAWDIVQQYLPAQYAELAQFDSYFAWREVAIKGLTDQYVAQGMPPGSAAQQAEARFQAHDVVKAFSRSRGQLEQQFITQYSTLADQAAKFGYLQLKESERQFITEDAAVR